MFTYIKEVDEKKDEMEFSEFVSGGFTFLI